MNQNCTQFFFSRKAIEIEDRENAINYKRNSIDKNTETKPELLSEIQFYEKELRVITNNNTCQ